MKGTSAPGGPKATCRFSQCWLCVILENPYHRPESKSEYKSLQSGWCHFCHVTWSVIKWGHAHLTSFRGFMFQLRQQAPYTMYRQREEGEGLIVSFAWPYQTREIKFCAYRSLITTSHSIVSAAIPWIVGQKYIRVELQVNYMYCGYRLSGTCIIIYLIEFPYTLPLWVTVKLILELDGWTGRWRVNRCYPMIGRVRPFSDHFRQPTNANVRSSGALSGLNITHKITQKIPKMWDEVYNNRLLHSFKD